MYYIKNKKNDRLFGNGIKFNSLEDIKNQLISFLSLDENYPKDIKDKNLYEIAEIGDFYILNINKNIIEKEKLEQIK